MDTVNATIDFPEGPAWIRRLGYMPFLLVPFLIGACVLGWIGIQVILFIILYCFAALYTVPLLRPRFRARPVNIEVAPGKIRIRGGGWLNATIGRRALLGAFPARIERATAAGAFASLGSPPAADSCL